MKKIEELISELKKVLPAESTLTYKKSNKALECKLNIFKKNYFTFTFERSISKFYKKIKQKAMDADMTMTQYVLRATSEYMNK